MLGLPRRRTKLGSTSTMSIGGNGFVENSYKTFLVNLDWISLLSLITKFASPPNFAVHINECLRSSIIPPPVMINLDREIHHLRLLPFTWTDVLCAASMFRLLQIPLNIPIHDANPEPTHVWLCPNFSMHHPPQFFNGHLLRSAFAMAMLDRSGSAQ